MTGDGPRPQNTAPAILARGSIESILLEVVELLDTIALEVGEVLDTPRPVATVLRLNRIRARLDDVRQALTLRGIDATSDLALRVPGRTRAGWLCDGCKNGWEVSAATGYGAGAVLYMRVLQDHAEKSPNCQWRGVWIQAKAKELGGSADFIFEFRPS